MVAASVIVGVILLLVGVVLIVTIVGAVLGVVLLIAGITVIVLGLWTTPQASPPAIYMVPSTTHTPPSPRCRQRPPTRASPSCAPSPSGNVPLPVLPIGLPGDPGTLPPMWRGILRRGDESPGSFCDVGDKAQPGWVAARLPMDASHRILPDSPGS